MFFSSNLICPYKFHNFDKYSHIHKKIKNKYDSNVFAKIWEEYIARYLKEKYGEILRNYKIKYANIIGKIDIYVFGKEAWECKWTTQFDVKEVFKTYLPQLVFYMMATGVNKGYMACANPVLEQIEYFLVERNSKEFKETYDYILEVINKKSQEKKEGIGCYFCPIKDCEFNRLFK